MKNLTLKLIFGLVILSASLFANFLPVSALDCSNPDTKIQLQCGTCEAAGIAPADCKPGESSGALSDTVKTVINVISVLGGAAAVVMIIVGGFRYTTSAGNSEATKSARNTIAYAVVGLIVIALAQIIVHFVLIHL